MERCARFISTFAADERRWKEKGDQGRAEALVAHLQVRVAVQGEVLTGPSVFDSEFGHLHDLSWVIGPLDRGR